MLAIDRIPQFSWPADISGLERIMLSAHGDLQRLLRLVLNLSHI